MEPGESQRKGEAMLLAKFDLDSTLVNTDELIELALAENGFMLDPEKRTAWNYEFIEGYEPPPDFQWDVFFYRLLTERLDELRPIDEWVYDFLRRVSRGGHPIHVITARSEGILMHHACMSTLDRCFPDIEFYVTIVKSGSDKVRYLENADIMFEDRRKTARQLSKAGNIVLVPRKEYNAMDESDASVRDIRDITLESCRYGDIIMYDNFSQVLMSGLQHLIAPF
jgi:hypothetical protein